MAKIQVVIEGSYEPNASAYDGETDPEQWAAIDFGNYEAGNCDLADVVEWLDPDSIVVRFEAVP